MSDETVQTVQVAAPGGGVPVGTPTPQPAPSAQPDASADAAADPLANLTPDQLEQLATRIEETRRNRPPSLTEALSKLQQDLTSTHRAKEQAVDERKQASSVADQLESSITEIKQTLRRAELLEAATAAGFKAPNVVAQHLLGRDGDVTELVTELAASGAFAMSTPAASAQVGGPKSSAPAGIDPGMAALIAEINAAHGR